jgi:hypothetical protein
MSEKWQEWQLARTYINGGFKALENSRNGGSHPKLRKYTVFAYDGCQELLVDPHELQVTRVSQR